MCNLIIGRRATGMAVHHFKALHLLIIVQATNQMRSDIYVLSYVFFHIKIYTYFFRRIAYITDMKKKKAVRGRENIMYVSTDFVNTDFFFFFLNWNS